MILPDETAVGSDRFFQMLEEKSGAILASITMTNTYATVFKQ